MRDVLERLKAERRIAAVLMAIALTGFAAVQVFFAGAGSPAETPSPREAIEAEGPQ